MSQILYLEASTAPCVKASAVLPPGSRVIVTPDTRGIAQALVQQLSLAGYEARVSATLPAEGEAVILLEGLTQPQSIDEAIEINRQVFAQTQRIAPHFSTEGGLFVTVQDTGGRFGLTPLKPHQAWMGGLPGLVKTAALEWPQAHCKAIDLQCADQTPVRLAKRLMQEILSGDPTSEVGLLADGQRITLTLHSLEHLSERQAHTSYPVIEPQSVFVVTGGARGVVATCLLALAKRLPLRFLLLGRTPLKAEEPFTREAADEGSLRACLIAHFEKQGKTISPREIQQEISAILALREIQATLTGLTQAGSEVLYLPVDVSDLGALNAALETVRQQWGPIAGIVHGAGVLADKRIVEKTSAQFDLVFNTKVIGLKNLLKATQNDPLQRILFFSSVAGRFGNQGQCDYAMANEVLNKVAQQEAHRRQSDCHVQSINWGPWEGGMVNAQLKALFAQRGVSLLPLAEGAACFVNALLSEVPWVESVVGEKVDMRPGFSHTLHQAVQAQTHAYLKDHAIAGVPVLPAALALEWFIEAVKPLLPPEAAFVRVENFKVLRGIRFPDFAEKSRYFIVTLIEKATDPGCWQLSLIEENKPTLPYYQAEIRMTAPVLESGSFIETAMAQKKTGSPWEKQAIYHGPDPLLFHGPLFQVLHTLNVLSDEGGEAEITGCGAANPAPFITDLLGIDGGLQLLCLWGRRMLGTPSLPMAFQSGWLPVNYHHSGKLTCYFRSQLIDPYRTQSDLVWVQEDGVVYAEFCGVEMVHYHV